MPVEPGDPGGQPLLGPEARRIAAERLGAMHPYQDTTRTTAPPVGTTAIPSQAEEEKRAGVLAALDGAESVIVRARPTTGIDDGDGYGMAPPEHPPESPRAQLDREDRGWRVIGRVTRMLLGR